MSTIGVLIFAARVTGSRQSSASASTRQAARQAAEYGYAEIMAEMNREAKSYLWVLDSRNWNNVSAQDLKTCGVASSADPSSDPIPALTSNQTLSRSPELSYRIKSYEAPTFSANPTPLPPSYLPAVCKNKFANLIGGSGVLTIEGTFNRGSGDTSTYTLKRTVSVNRAAPIFNNPITAQPPNRSVDAADSRFPIYPDAGDSTQVAYPGKPIGSYIPITCTTGASAGVIKCTDDSTGLFQDFNSEDGTTKFDFPYTTSADDVWPAACKKIGNPPNEVVRCFVESMTVATNMYVTTNRPSDNKPIPVEFFLTGEMIINRDSKLSGFGCPTTSWSAAVGCARPRLPKNIDPLSWSRFRIFGVSSGTSCPNQTITIDSYNNSAPTPATVEPNLQNAFLWLSKGALKYQSSTVITSIPALVGSICRFQSSVAAPAYLSTLSNSRFFEGLGGAYGFRGVFGGAAPIRFFYRGFGFSEQPSS
ncbi:MAG: hypothetical protein NTW51_10185 [Cyanobacteria bacterium]|nr:hypothetical protein [Cyanobacteriota bacterium]